MLLRPWTKITFEATKGYKTLSPEAKVLIGLRAKLIITTLCFASSILTHKQGKGEHESLFKHLTSQCATERDVFQTQ